MSENRIEKEQRVAKRVMQFSDLGIKRLNAKRHLDDVNQERRRRGLGPVSQDLIWDTAQKGLALLVGRNTKTFRCQFKLGGKWLAASIGRYGELVPDADPAKENTQVAEARRIAADWRAKAKRGIDPRSGPTGLQSSKLTFCAVVDQFIQRYARPRQRTWDQTQRVLTRNCAAWLNKPIEDITKIEARTLLRGFIAEGHPAKAGITHAWLTKLWKWAYKEDLVTAPMMDAVEIHTETRVRDRVYSDAETKATWNAANGLDAFEAAYVKLLVLLAPRKTALAMMRWSHLDNPDNPTLWTTPFELTKSRKSSTKKRQYLTPLPPLAQRILKSPPRHADRVFPSLRVHETEADVGFHAWRHTVATWLQNAGHSEWEIGLVLNHAGSGVTAGYSHGYPLDLKRKLLGEWADHVEQLVQPEGAVLLR